MLRTLETNGFVIRDPNPNDARARSLRLTDKAREVLTAAREEVRPASARFFEPLGEDVETLTKMLRRVIVAAEANESEAC